MRNLFLIMFAVLLCCSSNEALASAITQDEALLLVKSNRSAEGLSNTDVNFYITEVDTIVNNYRCPVDMTTVTEQWLTDDTPKWLVFVDEEPLKVWSHSCSYYYMPIEYYTQQNIPITKYMGCLPPNISNIVGIEKTYEKPQYSFTNLNLSNHRSLLPGINVENNNKIGALFIGPDGDCDDLPRTNADFSLLYQMLTQRFGVDPSNIMMFLGGSSRYGTQPMYSVDCDLDGDGEDETIHNYDIWFNCFERFRQEFSNAHIDHLFVFMGPVNASSYIGLTPMLSENYSIEADMNTLPGEVKTVLSCDNGIYGLNDGVVINTNATYSDNTLLTPLVSNWVDALLEQNHENNMPIFSDSNSDGFISIREAYNYASSHTADSVTISCDRYNPKQADIISFEYTPHAEIGLGMRQTNGYSKVNWDSPDIWIRNQDDGLTNQESESITVNPSGNNTKYIYAKVRNIGLHKLELLESCVNFGWSYNSISCSGEHENINQIGTTDLEYEMEMEVGDSCIVKYEWELPSSLVSSTTLNGGVLSISLQANTFPGYSNYSKSRAQVTFYDVTNGNIVLNPNAHVTKHGIEIPISIENISSANLGNYYSIEIIPGRMSSSNLNNKISIELELSSYLYRIWQAGGSNMNGFTQSTGNNKKFNYVSGHASLGNIPAVYPTETIMLSIFCNQNAFFANDEKSEIFLVVRNESGEIVDGQTFTIYANGSNSGLAPGDGGGVISPGIGVGYGGSNILLSAQNIYEPVDYEWYEDGLLVGENTEKLSLPVTEGNNSITLHVISTDDNKQGYAQIMLQDYNFIKSAGISQSVANIQLLKPALAGTTITVSSLTTGAIFSTDVPEGETDVLIPCDDSPLFAVSVSVGGIIKDYQKLLK